MMALNVLGEALACCCTNPLTGFYRDGYCKTDENDRGRHVICAKITNSFLQFTLQRGNDLITPNPLYNFPGLKEGDKWCLCALRWKEAYEAGVAPKVFLACTHEKALEFVTLPMLQQHAVEG
jgi:uncharacterized protein